MGLDNISVFDRSQPLPTCGELEQADGTAWMAFYSLTLLAMAIELSKTNAAYEDLAAFVFLTFHLNLRCNELGWGHWSMGRCGGTLL